MAFRNLLVFALCAAPSVFAVPITYTTLLSGLNENPSNASPATGSASVTIDTIAHLLTVNITFTGLQTNTTASHIHCCVAAPGNVGVATQTPTFVGFPLAVTSGSYSNTFDTTLTSSFNASFVTNNGGTAAGAEAALANGLAAGRAYVNIHTVGFPGGEIRGFLTPEPGSFVLLGAGLAGLALWRPRSLRAK